MMEMLVLALLFVKTLLQRFCYLTAFSMQCFDIESTVSLHVQPDTRSTWCPFFLSALISMFGFLYESTHQVSLVGGYLTQHISDGFLLSIVLYSTAATE